MRWLRNLVVVCALAGSACHAPYNIQTPQGQIAYTADQIVVRINELERAAIAANTSGAISTDTTRIIVTFCVDADRTLAALPVGWRASVLTAWVAAKEQLMAVTNPALIVAIGSVDVALAVIQ